VARAVFGADAIGSGAIEIFGQPVKGGPRQRRALGVALIPESRKSEGLALGHSVHMNLLMCSLPKLSWRGLIAVRRARQVVQDLITTLGIATSSPRKIASQLSGGNQQKIVIGKWLAAGARLFILDEPTRGIDVGAKEEVFRLIDALVKKGASVLLISSELHEIVRVCDRAYVMREGRVAGHLGRQTLSEQAILSLAMHHE
jgi:ribose transport system ATP-binding protein